MRKSETPRLTEHHEKTSLESLADAKPNIEVDSEESNKPDYATSVTGVYNTDSLTLAIDSNAALVRDASVGREASGVRVASGGGPAGIEIVEPSV